MFLEILICFCVFGDFFYRFGLLRLFFLRIYRVIAQNDRLVKEVLSHFTEHLLDTQSDFSAQKSDFRLGKEERNLETSQK